MYTCSVRTPYFVQVKLLLIYNRWSRTEDTCILCTCLENTLKHLKLSYHLLCKQLSCVFVRSSNQSSKPVKLPVTPSTATLTKSQKNKHKTKKKPVENKMTKQTSPVKNATPPTVSSSQVWHHGLLGFSWEFASCHWNWTGGSLASSMEYNVTQIHDLPSVMLIYVPKKPGSYSFREAWSLSMVFNIVVLSFCNLGDQLQAWRHCCRCWIKFWLLFI